MQPFQRQHFICSAIEQCRETSNCCPHKTPHIKDERCVPRECRYAPGADSIDCDPFDPENPRAPVPAKAQTVKTVEQRMKENIPSEPIVTLIDDPEPMTPEDLELYKRNCVIDTVPSDETVPEVLSQKQEKEQDIKEAVKKAQKKGPGKKKVPEKQL
jgi:hypothetical protein